MKNEDRILVHKGCKWFIDQQESVDRIQAKIKETFPNRKESVTIREIVDEGLIVLKKRYGIK